MAKVTVNDNGAATKSKNRTKIVGNIGMRVRVQKPGETEEQMERWRSRICAGGHTSLVLPSQELLDRFIAIQREGRLEYRRRAAYQKTVDEVMRKYWAGELVERSKVPTNATVANTCDMQGAAQ